MQTRILRHAQLTSSTLLRILGFALTMIFGVLASWCQVTTTTVQDTVYNADGTYASGEILVSWPAFVTAGGDTVAAGNLSSPIGNNGTVTMNLAPNLGATPAGSYYTAVYHLADGTVSKEYWVIPDVPSTSIAAIRSLVMPASIAVQTITATQVSSMLAKYLPLSGGSLTGTLQLPSDPSAPMQAATKNYVDNSLSPIATELSQAVSSSPKGTQTVTQPVGTNLSANILQGRYYASQFQSGSNNNGIANVTGSSSCANASPGGLSGCTVDVDPTYPNTERPQGYGFSYGNQTANFPWPLDTHVHDIRNGVTADYYENPFSNVPYQTEGQVIAADFTLDFQKWPAYGGTNAQAESLQTTAFQGGYNFDNYFVGGQPIYFFKTYYGNLNMAATNYTSGQMEAVTNNVNCHGTGDCLGMTLNVTCDGGVNSANDEGCHGGDWNVSEDPKVYTGTLPAAVAVGATSFMTNGTNGQGTQGQDRLLVDLTTGVISGNSFASGTGSLATGPAGNSAISPPSATDPSANYPVSTMVQLCYPGNDNGAGGAAGCTAGSQPTGYIPSAPNMINPASSITTNVVASYTGTAPQTGLPANFCTPATLQSSNSAAACYLPASGTACISDQEEYESVNYTYNATAQTITLLNLRFPHENGVFFAHGGLCGYAVESAADIFTSGPQSYSQVFPVLGSPTSTSLYYISQRTNLGYTQPILGMSNNINGYTSGNGGECFTLNAFIFQLQSDNKTVVVATNVPFNTGDLRYLNGMTLNITTPNSTYNGSYMATYGVIGGANEFSYVLPTTPTGTAPTSGTVSFCNENYKLYPAVRVNSVLNASTQQVDGTMNTMPVPVAMAANDTVEEPHYMWIQTAHDAGRGVNQYLPRQYLGGYLYGMTYNFLLSGNVTGFDILNGTAQNEYLGYGGTHVIPTTGYHLQGAWQDSLLFDQPGDDATINILGCKPYPVGCANATSNFNVIKVPGYNGQGGQYSALNYDPKSGMWNFLGTHNYVTDPPPGNFGVAGQSMVNLGTILNPVAMYATPFTYGGQVSWTWTPAHPEPNVWPLAGGYGFGTTNTTDVYLSDAGNKTINCGNGGNNCTLNVGTLNAGSVATSTLAATKSVQAQQLTVGTSSTVSSIAFYNTGSIAPAAVPAGTCTDQTFTVTGLLATDNLGSIAPPAALGNLSISGYASGANTLTLHLCNVSASSVTPPAGAYSFLAVH